MHRFFQLRAALLAGLLVLAVAPHAPAAETRIRVNVFANPQNIALYAAQQKGFFTRHGLAVEIQFTPNSRAQRTGLVQGAFDIAQYERVRHRIARVARGASASEGPGRPAGVRRYHEL